MKDIDVWNQAFSFFWYFDRLTLKQDDLKLTSCINNYSKSNITEVNRDWKIKSLQVFITFLWKLEICQLRKHCLFWSFFKLVIMIRFTRDPYRIHQMFSPILNSESTYICYDFFFNWQTKKKTCFGPVRFFFQLLKLVKTSDEFVTRREYYPKCLI